MSRKLLVLGSSGLVGSAFVNFLQKNPQDDLEILTPTREELDVEDFEGLKEYIHKVQPSVVLNLAAYTKVDEAQSQKGDKDGLVYKLNTVFPGELAKVCSSDIHFLHASTAYVFTGNLSQRQYKESDKTGDGQSLSWYGYTKKLGEDEIIRHSGKYTIFRFDMPYTTTGDKKGFAFFFYEKLQNGEQVTCIQNQFITPINAAILAKAIFELIDQEKTGLYHLGSTDPTTPFDFAKEMAFQLGIPSQNLIQQTDFFDYSKNRPAPRPQYAWLDISKFKGEVSDSILKSSSQNIKEFLADLKK